MTQDANAKSAPTLGWACLDFLKGSLLAMAVIASALVILPRSLTNRVLHPGYGCCGHCHRTWDVVRPHYTDYLPGRGCFALCEPCWETLGSPEDRLPFYEALLSEWDTDNDESGRYFGVDKYVRRAVLEGK
jgi:hypothetical protein